VAKAREVDSVVGQITEASKEQNSGLEQINSAINLMSQVTQANAAGSEQTASASEELTAQSIELRSGVDVLVKLVNGKSFAETHPKIATKVVEPVRKAEHPPVKPLDLSRRKNNSVLSASPNGYSNGHSNGNGHGNGNGNGNGKNDYDDSFFDM
jgi:hypothetical protein